jgi:hypothetical protein
MGKWGRRLTIIPILFLVAMIFGNHTGNLENWWLAGIAVLMVVILVIDARRRKNAWRAQ